MKDIYEQNVHDLQKQLQEAYAHINELNKVKVAAKAVVDAQDKLSAYAHYNPGLMCEVDKSIESLRQTL